MSGPLSDLVDSVVKIGSAVVGLSIVQKGIDVIAGGSSSGDDSSSSSDSTSSGTSDE